MSKLEKQKEKARSLEAKDPKGAIEAWQHVLKGQEEDGDPNPDLTIFNRIGDLYLKVREPAQAADYYDQAVDKYAELGFHNNAIAMCNKVLRNAPGRQTTYLKLAKLYASKGFMAEAKQNFVEYAERMHKAGKIQHAFAALKEFADISAESAHLRQTLEDHLRMYGDPERRPGAGTAAPVAPKPQPPDDPSKSGRRKTSSLVFLDVDAPPAGKPPVVAGAAFGSGGAERGGGQEGEDQPLAIDDAGVGRVGGGRRSGALDLSLDGVVTQGDEPGSLVFADIDAPPVKPTIEDLEGRVADDPDDPESHKALGEALIEAGERERGIEELDLATTGFETRGNLRQAQDLGDEILRLDPNSVRHRQKQVEFAFKSGDKAKLIDAYVELADTRSEEHTSELQSRLHLV